MNQNEVDAGQCLDKRDFLFEEEISTLALEALVGLFLHDDDYITCLLSRVLVGLAVECVLLIIRRALVDLGVEHLLLFRHLLALASLALVGLIDDFTFATAIIARTL